MDQQITDAINSRCYFGTIYCLVLKHLSQLIRKLTKDPIIQK